MAGQDYRLVRESHDVLLQASDQSVLVAVGEIGAPYAVREQTVTAKQQGLKCQFFPIDIVRHDDITNTINNISKSSMLMGRGAYTYIAHPLSFIARIPLNSFRLKKKYRVPFWHSVKNMLAGVRYYNKHRHDKQSYQ